MVLLIGTLICFIVIELTLYILSSGMNIFMWTGSRKIIQLFIMVMFSHFKLDMQECRKGKGVIIQILSVILAFAFQVFFSFLQCPSSGKFTAI